MKEQSVQVTVRIRHNYFFVNIYLFNSLIVSLGKKMFWENGYVGNY